MTLAKKRPRPFLLRKDGADFSVYLRLSRLYRQSHSLPIPRGTAVYGLTLEIDAAGLTRVGGRFVRRICGNGQNRGNHQHGYENQRNQKSAHASSSKIQN